MNFELLILILIVMDGASFYMFLTNEGGDNTALDDGCLGW